MPQRPKRITISPTAADADGVFTTQDLGGSGDHLINGALSTGFDANGIAESQTPAAGGSQDLTLDGALTQGGIGYLDTTYLQYVTITSAGNDSARSFVVEGVDAKGTFIKETISGPNATTSIGSTLFLRVTKVTVDDDTAGAITVGVNGYVLLSQPQHITITSAVDSSGDTFTVEGEDRYGNSLSESITGPNATVVAGAENFALVQKVSVGSDPGGNITSGVDGTCESQWVPMNRYDHDPTGLSIIVSGTNTSTVQFTHDDIGVASFREGGANTFNHATIATETASATGTQDTPVSAFRLAITAFTSGSVEFQIVPGN